MPSGDVASKRQANALIGKIRGFHDPRDDIDSGIRTLYRVTAMLLQYKDIFVGWKNEVRGYYRSVIQKAGLLINAGVTAAIRIEAY